MALVIRPALVSDAAALLEFVRAVVDEDTDILLSPGEFQMTVEEEERFLAKMAQAENSLMLVAELEGRIVGSLHLAGGERRANRHSAMLGMSVSRAHRDQGIGRKLLLAAQEWAAGSGILQRIELFVIARNQRAVHLYRKLGFVEEGRRTRALCRGGNYLDDLLMAWFVP